MPRVTKQLLDTLAGAGVISRARRMNGARRSARARRSNRGAAPLLVAGFLFCRASAALQQFPGDLKNDLKLANVPDCTLCHGSEAGGKGTARQKFALTLQKLGLSDHLDDAGLAAAVQTDQDCNVDSDGDGISDVEELKRGTNPNDGNGAPSSTCGDVTPSAPALQTGCAVARADARRGDPAPGGSPTPSREGTLFVGVLIGLALLRRV